MKGLDWIFPRRCLICRGFSEENFCRSCAAMIPPASGCDLGFVPSFDLVVAWGRYEGAVADLIGRLKFGGEERIASHLGELLARRLDGAGFDQIIPVPLDRRGLRRRGFNQSVLIGREIGRRFRILLDPFLLEKRRETETQLGLSREERLRNLTGAFWVNRNRRLGKTILLVDDVMTTGATAEACAVALKEAGADRVEVAVVARTPSPALI